MHSCLGAQVLLVKLLKHRFDKPFITQIAGSRRLIERVLGIHAVGYEPRKGATRWAAMRVEHVERFINRQPVRRRRLTHHRAITAPRPISGSFGHAGIDRIEHHIARQFQQVRLPLHQDGFVAPLQHVPNTPMTRIECLGVHTIDLAHPLRKGRTQGLDQKMIVIRHLTPGPNAPVEPPAHTLQIVEERLTILLAQEDIGPCVASRHDVIKRAVELDSKWSGHEPKSSDQTVCDNYLAEGISSLCMKQDLTPFSRERPIRQWVLSLPFPLRFLLATNPTLISRVLGIIYRVIAAHLIKQAGYTQQSARTGAVTLIQRFGSALNLNIHFHMLFLDGVYELVPDGTGLRFQWVREPTSAQLT